jgi:hypothetical protein
MHSSGRRATRKTEGVAGAALLLALSCGGTAAPAPQVPEPAVAVAPDQPPYDFEFDSLDDRPVSSKATSGRPTVLCFLQTGDVWSQAEVNYLVRMAQSDGDRVNYWLVALEPRQSRELVEIYRRDLGVTFPTALGDMATNAAPFALVKVPTTVVLDRNNKVVWRIDGRVARADEIRDAMRATHVAP